MEIDGYIIEESWDCYSYNIREPEIKHWFTVPWTQSFRKKFYSSRESALDAINQMKKCGRAALNIKYAIVPLYKGEREIICGE